jgi:Fic family protein
VHKLTDLQANLIPPVTYETHHWLAVNNGMVSRAALSAATGTYRSTIPAKISDLNLSIPSSLASDAEEAAFELAKFDSYSAVVLGSKNPSLGPMSSILLRTESTSSSQIENLTVGAKQLALAEIDQSTSTNANVVVGNVRAMEAALRLSECMDENAVLSMQSELVSRQPGWERQAGKYRQELVWVGSSSISPIGAIHIAPQSNLVPAAMADLILFMQRNDIPVVIQAAIAHAQFETIHPFADGNGRTGRALVHALLHNKGLMQRTTAPVSAGLLHQTKLYFAALNAYRLGDTAPVIQRFSEACRFAASSGKILVDSLSEEVERSFEKLSGFQRMLALAL